VQELLEILGGEVMPITQWIALFAAFGFGSFLAAVLSRWSVISSLRQAWINALRDDLAAYLKEIDALHFEQLGTDHLETRGRAFLVYRRILLRLNIKEDLHVQLAGRLEDLLNIGDINADNQRIDEAVALARRIFKQEWNVTKYGIFANLKAPEG
jgi:hypothetical protein